MCKLSFMRSHSHFSCLVRGKEVWKVVQMYFISKLRVLNLYTERVSLTVTFSSNKQPTLYHAQCSKPWMTGRTKSWAPTKLWLYQVHILVRFLWSHCIQFSYHLPKGSILTEVSFSHCRCARLTVAMAPILSTCNLQYDFEVPSIKRVYIPSLWFEAGLVTCFRRYDEVIRCQFQAQASHSLMSSLFSPVPLHKDKGRLACWRIREQVQEGQVIQVEAIPDPLALSPSASWLQMHEALADINWD